MLKASTPETAIRGSQRIGVIFAVILFAVTANVISSSLVVGVNPFELAVSNMIIGTFGLAIINNILSSVL
jgi:drug/metabolite transporter, DME family